MTAEEYRSNPELVRGLRELLETNDSLRLALEVMAGEHPVRGIPATEITPQFANIQLGQNVGYETYDYRFKLLAKGLEIPQTTPEAKYEESEE